jgi:primosomal protein N' (replication factor Y)
MFAALDKTVQILVPAPVGEAFDYAVPASMAVGLGDYVIVPMAGRKLTGVVWSARPATVAANKLKSISQRLELPPMPQDLRNFIDWVAAYTMQPLGLVLKLALTTDSAQEAQPQRHYLASAAWPPTLKLTAARRRVLAILDDGIPRSATALAEAADCTPSVVTTLYKEGGLRAAPPPDYIPPQPDLAELGPTLSASQQKAADVLVQKVKAASAQVALLEGVTGSGKTEVYAHAIRAALQQGKQVLVLLPEIALSVHMIARFVSLFGAEPVQWHSDLASGARQRAWRSVANGTARLVIGARSALFLPFKELGLIVVDEEHEGAYKQEEGVTYHARDMAVARAHRLGIACILSSATPSVETVVNVQEGRYSHVMLPDRHAGAQLPSIALVDMLKAKLPRQHFIAPESVDAIRAALGRGEQALLFLNRRGYAPLTICRGCGHRITCPNCTAWLVEHRSGPSRGKLECHHCGHREPLPNECPHCHKADSFAACGPGVERIEDEVKSLFPDARTLVIASDSLGGWRRVQQALDDVRDGKFDIIIGTQIVAKGHHFPLLTCVVVLDADLGLDGGDLRANERAFQLLQQVSGRAGRAQRPGTVLMQTHCANNFLFQNLALNDRESFLAHEIALREEHHWPPFARLAAIVIGGREQHRVEAAAQEIRKTSPQVDGVEIFGPAPAPLAKLKGEHRVRLLVRAPRTFKLQAYLTSWLGDARVPKGVSVKIVIDPFTFL